MIKSPKRESNHPIEEVTESTDFHCQRTNLVQFWLCITKNNNEIDLSPVFVRTRTGRKIINSEVNLLSFPFFALKKKE